MVLLPDRLVQILELFMLLANDLLILEFQKLAFLLKVSNDLTETLFE